LPTTPSRFSENVGVSWQLFSFGALFMFPAAKDTFDPELIYLKAYDNRT